MVVHYVKEFLQVSMLVVNFCPSYVVFMYIDVLKEPVHISCALLNDKEWS